MIFGPPKRRKRGSLFAGIPQKLVGGEAVTRACSIFRGRFGRVALLDMDTSLVGHAHPHCHLIFKVAGPDQEFEVEGKAVPLRRDTVVAVNAWQQHAYDHRPSGERTLFLAFYIEPNWLAEADRIFLGCARPRFFPRACVAIGAEIERLRTHLVEHMAEGTIDRPEELQQLILDLCLEVSYGFADWRSCRSPVSGAPRDFRIGRALRYMRDGVGGPLDLDGVARVSGLSRPHFNHLFRACIGLSPRLYLNALRIEAAVGRLHQQDDGIGVISDALGFSAQSNFTRFFRQHTGTSPHQFRRVLDDLG
jgi:AraC family transcriptional regulator